MIRKLAITSALVVAFAVPALAATHYYVAQDATSKKCSVAMKKPDGKTMMMMGKSSYKTEADAKAAMAKDTGCAK